MEALASEITQSGMDSFMNRSYTVDNANRLLKALIEKYQLQKPSDAEALLNELRLGVVCGEKIRSSAAFQSALLTIVNTGKRAFLGGVFVSLPPYVELLVPWPECKSLNEVINKLGGKETKVNLDEMSFGLTIGCHSDRPNSLEILCNGWVGGVTSLPNYEVPLKPDFALGGVFAGALGVGCAFLRACGLDNTAAFKPMGFSLWKPNLNWLDPEASGPELIRIPKKIWVLGLGHLGQAYLWCLGLLSIPEIQQMEFMLQDFDSINKANLSTGVLSEEDSLQKLKTQNAADWLRSRKFNVKVTDRRFDNKTQTNGDEPYVALCGFDSLESRQLLDEAGFDVIVECALGATLENFDSFSMHVLPCSRSAKEIWAKHSSQKVEPAVVEAFEKEAEANNCGVIMAARELAAKGISSSFVGCVAAAVVISELIRAWHEGDGFESIKGQMRNLDISAVPATKPLNWARNGYVGRVEMAKMELEKKTDL